MKILFDTHGCPLANNGGSSTIVKSANTLVDLGHEVTIIANARNQHDWTPLKANYKIFCDINNNFHFNGLYFVFISKMRVYQSIKFIELSARQ